MIKSEKTSTYSMFGINMERFGGSWFSVTYPHDRISYLLPIKINTELLNRSHFEHGEDSTHHPMVSFNNPKCTLSSST